MGVPPVWPSLIALVTKCILGYKHGRYVKIRDSRTCQLGTQNFTDQTAVFKAIKADLMLFWWQTDSFTSS